MTDLGWFRQRPKLRNIKIVLKRAETVHSIYLINRY